MSQFQLGHEILYAERRCDEYGRLTESDDPDVRDAGIAAHARAERELVDLQTLRDAVTADRDAHQGIGVQVALAGGRAEREAGQLARLDRVLEGNPRAATALSELIRKARRDAR